jgi:hypothetical protein
MHSGWNRHTGEEKIPTRHGPNSKGNSRTSESVEKACTDWAKEE